MWFDDESNTTVKITNPYWISDRAKSGLAKIKADKEKKWEKLIAQRQKKRGFLGTVFFFLPLPDKIVYPCQEREEAIEYLKNDHDDMFRISTYDLVFEVKPEERRLSWLLEMAKERETDLERMTKRPEVIYLSYQDYVLLKRESA